MSFFGWQTENWFTGGTPGDLEADPGVVVGPLSGVCCLCGCKENEEFEELVS